MKRPRAHTVIPPLIMAAAAAVPVGTATEILTHAQTSDTGSTLAAAQLPTSTPSAAATSTPTPSSAAKPAATPASTPQPAPRSTPRPTTQTYQGSVIDYRFGTVQATITVTGNRITDVQISAVGNEQRSQFINAQAVPLLRQETLQAQSAGVDTISGATLTSEAYVQSLQSALDQAHL